MIYPFLLAHLVADFVLQPLWLVNRKQRWDGLLIHGGIVLACMLLLPFADATIWPLWPMMLAITAIHIGADWWKVRYSHWLPGPAIVSFMFDQVVHITTIVAVLSLTLPAECVWTAKASVAGHISLYTGVYVIAAFAVPIAVMIWLDPTFAHVARAGAARLRSFIASAIVVSLVLSGSVLALPPILLGLAVVMRYPASAHPLDMPFGLLTTLSIAATLASLLVVVPM